jgi:hypothetical protein
MEFVIGSGAGLFLIAIVWIYQFIQLMLLSERDFPGGRDKVLWAAAFIVMFPLAPFAFIFWKTAYRAMREKLALESVGAAYGADSSTP